MKFSLQYGIVCQAHLATVSLHRTLRGALKYVQIPSLIWFFDRPAFSKGKAQTMLKTFRMKSRHNKPRLMVSLAAVHAVPKCDLEHAIRVFYSQSGGVDMRHTSEDGVLLHAIKVPESGDILIRLDTESPK